MTARILMAVTGVVACASVTLAQIPDDSPVRAALQRAETAVIAIEAIPGRKRTFENTIVALDDMYGRLEIDTNMIRFMPYVSTDPDERDAGERAEQDVADWLIDLEKREPLYDAVRAYAERASGLTATQQRLLDHTLRDFRRAGMSLSPEKRAELTTIHKTLNKLSIEFEKNIRQDETTVPLTREELAGMPDEYFENPSLRQSGDLYMVDVSYPQFNPIMEYCQIEQTRHKMWVAYKRRAGTGNVRVIEQIIELRAEAADLLGYDHPADYEIEIKMARNADTVIEFYRKLRPLVRKKALRDLEELVAAKRRHTGDRDAKIYPWDTNFYLNRIKKEKYAVDSKLVRQYFPLDAVLDGLFSITQNLYGLEYRDVTARARSQGRPLWHADARLYEVWDKATGEMLGEFYLDMHPRPNKYGHAAQWGLVQHKVWPDGSVSKPVAALVCNFAEPTADRPSLMSHDEVETFFHEFGHCLHTILSESTYYRFSGTSVERDFVEAPSQMFENWVWDADVLATFARHYETGKPLPDDLLDGMIRARHLGSGMAAERQFFYGLYDLKCHLDPDGDIDSTQLAWDLWDPAGENVELYDPVPETYFQSAFGHLTGYQAGYYGYQWSLVYACDMFQRFKELGMLSPDAGRYYRDKILSRGGTTDGMNLVRDYLGREPTMDAYLKHLGLDAE